MGGHNVIQLLLSRPIDQTGDIRYLSDWPNIAVPGQAIGDQCSGECRDLCRGFQRAAQLRGQGGGGHRIDPGQPAGA